MFKRVKLQLTLINISVVGIILVIFLSGIYILMKENTERQSKQLLYSVASEARKIEQRRNTPPLMRHWGNAFYVRYNSAGELISRSGELPVTLDELNTMLNKVFPQENNLGLIELGTDTFRYFRSYPPDLRDVTVVFLSTRSEEETLGRLGTILISTGLAGLILVFFSSLFLADRALIPIKKSWDRQKNFVADASHELRSPLTVIQTSLELVMGNKEETVESQYKWLENIQTENRRMTKLVNDLLFLARADSDQQMIQKTVFPIHETIRSVVSSYESVAAKKGIHLELKQADEANFFGDENRLKQLAVILIDNAIKYTSSGGNSTVSLRKLDSQIELVVSDTGEGIGSEHLDKIFKRFYRTDKARSRENGGTGLGLSIAKWIVKEHKGTISVSSKPGEGSTFKVLLPILQRRS